VSDRWVLAMLTDTNLRQGMLLLAVTATGDPTGTWRRFRFAVAQDPALTVDFTRMAMTADQIVITATEYDGDNETGVDIFTIPKSSAFGNTGTPAVTKTQALASDLTPVNSSDTTVRILGLGETHIGLLRLSGGSLTSLGTYVSPVPLVFGQRVCKQRGAPNPVNCGYTMLHYALLRDGVLWIVQASNDSAHAQIVVWKIIGSAATGYLIGDPSTEYAYPSIAVNRFGAALVGYSTLNSSIYPSAAYRYIDAAGNVSESVTVKDGEGSYSFFPWGDYSSTLVDPVDDTSFWTLQSYAIPAMTAPPFFSWATWWSYVQVKPPQRVRAVKH
jgi:hypothetical protein